MRDFAYSRVSTIEQNTDTQRGEIIARMTAAFPGYELEEHRYFADECSGGVMAAERKSFSEMFSKLEKGDRVTVLKIDRLGRDAIDILTTVKRFEEIGVQIVSLDVSTGDLNKPENKMMLTMLSGVAEMEKARIAERTREAIARIKSEGKIKLGRPAASETTNKVQAQKRAGLTQQQTAKDLGLSLATVKRHWNPEKLAEIMEKEAAARATKK